MTYHLITNQRTILNGVTTFLWSTNQRLKMQELATDQDVLEFGSLYGGSVITFAQTAKSVTAVDLFTCRTPEHETENTYDVYKRNTDNITNLTTIKGDMFSKSTLKKLRSKKYGLIYIDAEHTYEAVLKAVVNYLETLTPTGYITFDDVNATHFPEVIDAINYLVKVNVLAEVDRIDNWFSICRPTDQAHDIIATLPDLRDLYVDTTAKVKP